MAKYRESGSKGDEMESGQSEEKSANELTSIIALRAEL